MDLTYLAKSGDILTSAFCHRGKIKVHFSPKKWVEMYITTLHRLYWWWMRERPTRGFHQREITLIEHGTQNREKQVTVPGVIMESRTGERSISNPKPNGLRRACCRRERDKEQREGEKQRALWGQSVSAAGFNKCCERSKHRWFAVMHTRCLNTESSQEIRKES